MGKNQYDGSGDLNKKVELLVDRVKQCKKEGLPCSLDIRDIGFQDVELADVLGHPQVREYANDVLRFDFDGSSITTLPERLTMFKNLQVLCGKNASLQEVPSFIEKLENLKEVNFLGNKLRDLPSSMGKLKGLCDVCVAGNSLSSLPEFVMKLKNLKTLDISGNDFSGFPVELCDLKRLKRLDVSDNNIRLLPDLIGNMRCLLELRINNNNLKKLPISLFGLRNLSILHMAGNNLAELHARIGGLKNVRDLDVSGNLLSRIPHGLGGMKHLLRLNLSGNRLSMLPDSFPNLSRLGFLDISNNLFTTVGGQLRGLPLHTLCMSRNKLTCVPAEVCDMGKLKELDVGYNQLEEIPSALGNLKNLRILRVGGNKFQKVPEVLLDESRKLSLAELRVSGGGAWNVGELNRLTGVYGDAVSCVGPVAAANDVNVGDREKKDKIISDSRVQALIDRFPKLRWLLASVRVGPEGDLALELFVKELNSFDEGVGLSVICKLFEDMEDPDMNMMKWLMQRYHSQFWSDVAPEVMARRAASYWLREGAELGKGVSLGRVAKVSEAVDGMLNMLFLGDKDLVSSRGVKPPFRIANRLHVASGEQSFGEKSTDIWPGSFAWEVYPDDATKVLGCFCKTDGEGSLLRDKNGSFVMDHVKMDNIVSMYKKRVLDVLDERELEIKSTMDMIWKHCRGILTREGWSSYPKSIRKYTDPDELRARMLKKAYEVERSSELNQVKNVPDGVGNLVDYKSVAREFHRDYGRAARVFDFDIDKLMRETLDKVDQLFLSKSEGLREGVVLKLKRTYKAGALRSHLGKGAKKAKWLSKEKYVKCMNHRANAFYDGARRSLSRAQVEAKGAGFRVDAATGNVTVDRSKAREFSRDKITCTMKVRRDRWAALTDLPEEDEPDIDASAIDVNTGVDLDKSEELSSPDARNEGLVCVESSKAEGLSEDADVAEGLSPDVQNEELLYAVQTEAEELSEEVVNIEPDMELATATEVRSGLAELAVAGVANPSRTSSPEVLISGMGSEKSWNSSFLLLGKDVAVDKASQVSRESDNVDTELPRMGL